LLLNKNKKILKIKLRLFDKSLSMGLIYADIELINGEDISYARKYIIGEEEIKCMKVKALVDTGAYMLCINEEIQAQLKFPVAEKRTGQLANGQVIEYDVVSHVELKFKNRRTMCNAMVLPDNNEVLLRAIPMEDMDVLITSVKARINC
jgi:clan AA aspartic protease